MKSEDLHRLSNGQIERYSRQIVLDKIGYRGQRRLIDTKVCVVGLGGLGSPIVFQLAAMGLGHLRLVDCDVVELSNLHRQYLYNVNDLGYPKAEVAAEKIHELNPEIKIEPKTVAVNSNTAVEIIKGMDVVVDGLDRITPRYAINRACMKASIPYVFGAAIMTYGIAKTIIPHETACLECFQGGIGEENVEKCSVVGVHPSVLGIIGSIEVSEVVRIALGEKPQLSDKLFCCDVWDMKFDEIEIQRSEDCRVCGSKPSMPETLKEPIVTELCARNGKRSFLIAPRNDLNINMRKLKAYLSEEKIAIQINAKLGVAFSPVPGTKVSLLKSGVAVIEGMVDVDHALAFYEKVIIDGLSIPRSRIYLD
ncbi:MAG: HesA/MoeB/ThiF family protein [Methanomassiliicoccales archaeon]|jgi:adenylyltransferase/sulfurtransferase|nr:HesA/MoeB/ThiF family protein [Methanomassiliicoccales archaeon]